MDHSPINLESMLFRTALISDLPRLNKISIQSKKYWGYPDEWMERWLDDLTLDEVKLATQQVLVLELNHQVVGFCSIEEHADHYEIHHLWILPDFIGKGHGKHLLDAAIERFTRADKPIMVVSDPNAEPFYTRQGFVTFDKIESYPKGRYLPVMKKSIPVQ
jgi:ribosomal protein S18 acetylase RimI-like enzyme